MPSKLPRLFVKSPLRAGAEIPLEPDQAHYLANVLRLKPQEQVLVFNGTDGEWCARAVTVGKKKVTLAAEHQTRAQEKGPDLHYLFAPIKRARLDYMAQKATEMGASLLQPVLTRRTVAERVKTERLEANAVEAAEQCGILSVPEVRAPEKLDALIKQWDKDRLLIFADEAALTASPLETLGAQETRPLAVLIGPEGGFEPEERTMLLRQDFVVPVSLGPRIMRADTAAVACLALVNAVLGDWR
jgi:16S rRNA (uracil1498-N3)-methyltransferase